MNQSFVIVSAVIISILSIASMYLGLLFNEERRRRRELQTLLNQAVDNAQIFEQRYNDQVKHDLDRAWEIERASLQRQGIAVQPTPRKANEPDPPKRISKPMGGAARIAKFMDAQPKAVEPARIVGPVGDKVN